MMTKKQKQVLDFITTSQSRNGFSPSLDEIRKKFKLASVSTAHFHVSRLRDIGYVTKVAHKPRAIDVISNETIVKSTPQPMEGVLNTGLVHTDFLEKIDFQIHGKNLYENLPLNKILCGDAVEILKKIPSNSIDLAVTSPPYDDIRTYNGFSLDLPAVGRELNRVLKDGGVAAMVIQDSTRNFGKSLTSFRTIIDWCDNAGFKLFETVIYRKHGTEGAWWKKRFRVDHEYMPIFLKGDRPSFFNKEPLKIPSKHGGKTMTGSGNRRTDGTTTETVTRTINSMKCRGTVWDYLNAGDKNPLKRKHPATFPDKIPLDFIQCFCPPNGIVLDPFVGCGSTMVAAKQLGRNCIGIDISKEYCELARERIRATPTPLFS